MKNGDAAWCFAVASSAAVGFGHMRRCLALAAAMPRAPDFLIDAPESWVPALEAAGLSWRADGTRDDPARFASGIADAGYRGVLLDDYRFDDAYCRYLEGRVACARFDDFGTARAGDLVIAPSLAATPTDYPPGVRALCGARYAPVDDFIVKARAANAHRQVPDRARRILVAFGANDRRNLTALALEALDKLGEGREVTVVLGSDAPFLAELRARFASATCGFSVAPSRSELCDLLVAHDLAVGGAGVSFIERLCVGLPSIVIDAIDNQRANVEAARELGVATVVADGDLRDASRFAVKIDAVACDAALRARYRVAGRSLVDAEGGPRIAHVLNAEVLAA
jgi:UDP-2,4-diacetamido-2,4,6-trideoxy-beta-L-altropyranose hydrolase